MTDGRTRAQVYPGCRGGPQAAPDAAADGTIRKQVGNARVADPLRMMEELSAMLRRMKLPLDNKHEHIQKTVGQPR